MTNRGNVHTRQMRTPATDPKAVYMWLGYCHAREGMPFCCEYDTWNEAAQRNYEWGRGLAIAAKIATGKAPSWPRNRHITRMVPREVTMTEWAHHKMGARHA